MEKTFKVTSIHNVYEDSVENGEGKHVNNYTIDGEVKATDWKQALIKYFETEVFYKFDINNIDINEDNDFIYYSVLVDAEQLEPTKGDIESWKNGNTVLYSNNMTIYMQELSDVKFN